MIVARRGLGIAAACIVAALASGAISSACTLDLELTISCGDGYVDREAGEECDPADPEEAFKDACREIDRPEGEARCDELTCRIDRSLETCAACGDGIVDAIAGEECDGENLDGQVCDGDAGTLACYPSTHPEFPCKFDRRACRDCGNGKVEPELGEECDPRETLNLGTDPRPCAGDEEFDGIASPFVGEPPKPYASGTYRMCRETCTWERASCGYCGDGVLDDTPVRIDPYDSEPTSQPEECDGDAFSEARLMLSTRWEVCTTIENPHEPGTFLDGVRPNLGCNATCAAGASSPTCCVRAGEACPSPGTPYAEAVLEENDLENDPPLKCCWEYLHADEVAAGEDPCETVFIGEMIGPRVCRPFNLATE